MDEDGNGAMVREIAALQARGMEVATLAAGDQRALDYVVIGGEVVEIEKPPADMYVRVDTIADFVTYAADRLADAAAVVAIGKSVELLSATHCHHWDKITMPMEKTPERVALGKLMEGVDQRQLWELLVTDLRDAMGEGLLLTIQNIAISEDAADHVKISSVGLADASGHRAIRIQSAADGGAKHADIPENWQWSGALFKCCDEFQVTIELRLVVSKQNNGALQFRFVPIAMHKAERETRDMLARALREQLPKQYTIFSGEL